MNLIMFSVSNMEISLLGIFLHGRRKIFKEDLLTSPSRSSRTSNPRFRGTTLGLAHQLISSFYAYMNVLSLEATIFFHFLFFVPPGFTFSCLFTDYGLRCKATQLLRPDLTRHESLFRVVTTLPLSIQSPLRLGIRLIRKGKP